MCKQADGTCSQQFPCKPRGAAAARPSGKLTAVAACLTASKPHRCGPPLCLRSFKQEKQYDQRALVDVHTADGAVALQALTFIATGARWAVP